MDKLIDIGSDFSGVGAFEQALSRLNIKHNTIFACDKDKYARITYKVNYGKPKYFPEDVYERIIPEKTLDIYVSSPPCQSFSLAGKRKGEDDKRGILFYNTHEFIKVNNPRYFIIENVKGLLSDSGGNTFNKWITLLSGKSTNGVPILFPHEESVPYHVYWEVLNAKHYGVPQNRERVFIVGIRDDADNNFSFPKKQHLTKRLKDVLEENVDEKYYLSDKMINSFTKHKERHEKKGTGFQWQPKTKNDVANCIRANGALAPTDNTIKIKSATSKGYEESKDATIINPLKDKTDKGWHFEQGVYDENGITRSLKSSEGSGNKPKVMIGSIRGRNPDNPNDRTTGVPTKQRLELNMNGTSNALTTVQKDNVVVYGNLKGGKWDKTHEQSGRVYDVEGIAATIHTMGGGNQEPKIVQNYKIRRLTPRECFRLMDFPDSFIINKVSNTQAYKQAGNSIVVNVLSSIIDKLNL